MRKDGFYTALGTPLDDQGKVVKQSFVKQIEDQIASGASGLLVMGTMGALGTIRNSAYEEIIECACEAIAGRVTLLVGCSDNSLARVKDRFAILERYPVDIAVLTAPYYFKMPDQVLERFFARAAALTGIDIYLYDHVPITKHKITFPMMMNLSKIKNIKGIKSGDLVLIRQLHESKEIKKDFLPIFSGSDLFAVAQAYGIKNYLDGIFASFPKTIGIIQSALDTGNFESAKQHLNMMMDARDDMIALGIWPAFSYAMNLLGYQGRFAPDYEPELDEAAKQTIVAIMKRTGEIG